MKIAIVTPYMDNPGGVETVNRILIKIFSEAGHTIDLITADGDDNDIRAGVMLKLIGLPFVTAQRFKHVSGMYDVVICNGEFGWGISHPRCINLFHGSFKGYRDYLKGNSGLKQRLDLTRLAFIQRLAAKGKYVVAVSRFVKDILESDGIRVDEIISNCIDTEFFKPDGAVVRNNRYLFVGAYDYRGKGFDLLEKLADRGISIDCITNQFPGAKLGWIKNADNKEMHVIYKRFRAVIFPSRFEGLGLVPLEAMSCGVPVIMSNVGLGAELKDEIPEFVADGWDDRAVDEYLKKIELIEKEYSYFSQKARDYVLKKHSFEDYRKSWLDLLEEIARA